MLNKIVKLLLVVMCIASFSVVGQGLENTERRFILDETFLWLKKENAVNTIQLIKEAGFNVFVPCIWHGRGVTWKSVTKEKEPLWIKKASLQVDPLKDLIDVAHANGVEVHPWFTVALRPIEIFKHFYDKGTPEKAFDVHNPAFRDFIVNKILEVVRNYDVDGINLDYIRSMGICDSESCVESYKRITGHNLINDIGMIKKDKLIKNRIAKWNAKAINEIINRVTIGARAIKPNIIISVSSHAGLDILKLQGADSIKLANRGLIDFIFHIEYANKNKIRWDLIDYALQHLTAPKKFVLMVGNYEKTLLGPKPRKADLVAKLMDVALSIQSKPLGVALYQYPYLTQEQVDALKNGPFK